MTAVKLTRSDAVWLACGTLVFIGGAVWKTGAIHSRIGLATGALLAVVFLSTMSLASWCSRNSEALAPPASDPAPKSGRLSFLDALRGIAALIVVVQHSGEIAFPGFNDYVPFLPRPGVLGVGVFFVISGFVILRSLERDSTAGHFWTHRTLRIAPLYYLGLTVGIALLLAGVLHRTGVVPKNVSFASDLALNVVMVAGYLNRPCVLGVYWTLGYEVVFYLLVFGLVRGFKRRVSGPFALSLLATLLVGVFIPIARTAQFTDHFAFFALFAIGMLFHELDRGWRSLPRTILWILALLIAPLLASRVFVVHPPLALYFASYLPVPVMIFATAWGLRRFQVPQTLIWLGDVSFSVYVVHSIVVQSLPAWSGAGIAYVLAVVAITLPVATLSQRFVERPGIAYARRMTRGVAGNPGPSTGA